MVFIRKRLRQCARRVRSQLSPGPLILMYHRVAHMPHDPWGLAVSPEHFEQHLQAMRALAQPCSLSQLIGSRERGCQRRSVIVTFDDGYADNWYVATPLLQRYDVPATIFVTTQAVGSERAFWWDELAQLLLQPQPLPTDLHIDVDGTEYRWQLGTSRWYSDEQQRHDRGRRPWEAQPHSRLALYYAVWNVLRPTFPAERDRVLQVLWRWAGRAPAPPPYLALSPAELGSASAHDLIEIGGHTLSHPLLPARSPEQQRHEVTASKQLLERWLSRPVTSFSYPFGEYSATTTELVRSAGYLRACTTAGRRVTSADGAFELPRVEVLDWNKAEFTERLRRWVRY